MLRWERVGFEYDGAEQPAAAGGGGGTGGRDTSLTGANNAGNSSRRRLQRHVAAGGPQRGDLGHRRLLVPVRPDAGVAADRSGRRRLAQSVWSGLALRQLAHDRRNGLERHWRHRRHSRRRRQHGADFNANAQLLAGGRFRDLRQPDRGLAPTAATRPTSRPRAQCPDFPAPAHSTTRRSSATTTGTGTTTSNHAHVHPGRDVDVGRDRDRVPTPWFPRPSTYWTNLATSSGYTADAYLNTPVGVDFAQLRQAAPSRTWRPGTRPAASTASWPGRPCRRPTPTTAAASRRRRRSPADTTYRSYATINVANAVAAIEGYEAIHYLTAHHDWKYIDTNHDEVITAQEVHELRRQFGRDGHARSGRHGRSAWVARPPTAPSQPGLNNEVFNENPDDPAAEQRRFNFFDYAADGQLNGSVTINEFKMLGRILLPSPDAYTITDRQRASANGFLLAPTAQRNFVALQHTLPTYQWVSAAQVKKYRNVSPAQFGVGQNQTPGTYLPLYTLFDTVRRGSAVVRRATRRSCRHREVPTSVASNVTVDWLSAVPSSPTSTPTSTGTSKSSTTGATANASSTTTGGSTSDAAAAPNSNLTINLAVTTSTTSGTGTTSPSSTDSSSSDAQSLIASAQALAAAGQAATNSGDGSGELSLDWRDVLERFQQLANATSATRGGEKYPQRFTAGRFPSDQGLEPAGSLRATAAQTLVARSRGLPSPRVELCQRSATATAHPGSVRRAAVS